MDVARPRPEAPPVMMKVRCLICILFFFFFGVGIEVECQKDECEDGRVSEGGAVKSSRQDSAHAEA